MSFKEGDKVRYVGTVTDWQELGVGEVVELGVVSGDRKPMVRAKFEERSWPCTCYESSLEHIETKEEQTMEQVNKVYKELALVNGKLESLTTSGANLSYKEGQITYAPEGSMGIFVQDTLEEAQLDGKGNAGYKCKVGFKPHPAQSGTLVIHEATPLGSRCSANYASIFSSRTRYPAILLGKEVWRAEEPRPEPKFSTGQRVLATGGCYEGDTFSIDMIEWGMKEHWHAHYHYYMGISGMPPIDEDYLEIARPEPKFQVGDEVVVIGGRHELGARFKIGRVFWAKDEGLMRCPSDYLYNSVGNSWNYCEDMLELAPPEPLFKVGDRVELIERNTGASALHIGMILTIHTVKYRDNHYSYRVEENYYAYNESWFKPAPPEPEWVDVTKECEVKLFISDGDGDALFTLKHGDTTVFEIGNEGNAWRYPDRYEVRTTRNGKEGWNCNWFKVFKKV